MLTCGVPQAEKKAFEAREQLDLLLRSPEGVQKLKSSNTLDDMRRLVPEVCDLLRMWSLCL